MEEKSIAQMKKELKEFYFKEVKNNLEKINRIRKHEMRNSIFALGLLLGFAGLFVFGFLGVIPILICLGLIVLSIILLKFNNRHNKSNSIDIDTSGENVIKKQLMNNFLKIFGNLEWHQGLKGTNDFEYLKGLSRLNIMNYSILANVDDSIQGVYKGVKFRILEYDTSLSLQNIAGYLVLAPIVAGCGSCIFSICFGIVFFIAVMLDFFWLLLIIPAAILFLLILFISTYSSFRGVFVEFDMNKNFEGHTFLFEDASTNRGLVFNHADFEDVHLEDVEFCKKYKIFSDNQVEARFVLTPAFIERFKNMKMAFKAKYIRAAFKDKKITIAVNAGKDLFAMANFTKDTSAETFVELFNEILSVLQMIDALKLNQKIGL